MHPHTLESLEFDRVLQELASCAATQLGKELALGLGPLPSLGAILRHQQEATEARALLEQRRTIPFGGVHDVRGHVTRAMNGGVLRPEQLAEVADTIYGCRGLHRFLVDHGEGAPTLARYAAIFGRFGPVEDEVRRCIERGAVADRASKALREVRSEIATHQSRIQERLQSVLRHARTHLQEALITSRGGRYVVPVKASAKAMVPGTVHGASASGSTLFVEPASVRQLADELEHWRAMEEAEVEQVLATLSGLVAAHGDGLLATLGAVAELDLISARAKLSLAWDAHPVRWNEEGLIDLEGARHPLLGRGAVGNRIRMTAQERMLIVTGPNTGGKTLLLKTLGLLVLMARCGLHIPAAEGSTLCLFDKVLVDIGDSQSLEQSLSTFSGHIANVAPMLAQAGPRTLVLLDELGSGTDPHEGTALGIAMLEAFLALGAFVLTTTHLREIKEFGRVTPGCAIAGMGFDGETLAPTYRLLYGTLGESHGLAIAARNGLPAAVVARARELLRGEGAPHRAGYPHGTPPVRGLSGDPGALPTPEAHRENRGGPIFDQAAQSRRVGQHVGSTKTLTKGWGELGVEVAPAGPGESVSRLASGHLSARNPQIPEAPSAAVADPLYNVRPDTAALPGARPESTPLSSSRLEHTQPSSLPPQGAHLTPVLSAVSPARCRVWQNGAEREVRVHDLLQRQGRLVVGDRVRIRDGQAVEAGARANVLVHRNADTMAETVIAANLTGLLIVISARQPDFHASVLARHLLYAERQGVPALICLTKADLVGAKGAQALLQPLHKLGYPTFAVSAAKGAGLPALQAALAGGFTAVVGNPGAGKSTLLARLAPGARLSAFRSLQPQALALAPDGWLLDMPSLRELGVWKPDLTSAFREFGAYAGRCAQPGCLHREEKGCAVRQAVEEGGLARPAYERYVHLLGLMRLG